MCPKNFQISPSNVPKPQLAKKSPKEVPLIMPPLKNLNWNPETVPQVESAQKKMFQNCPPSLVNPNFFFLKDPETLKKNSTARKKGFKSVAKHEKKWKHKMKIESHPLFSPLVPIFKFWPPVFQTLWKSEKRGRNPKRGSDWMLDRGELHRKLSCIKYIPIGKFAKVYYWYVVYWIMPHIHSFSCQSTK